MSRPTPRQAVADLSLDTLAGGRWTLSERKPERFSLLVFYRGLHCPICKGWLGELDRLLSDFSRRGVEAIAISTDARERAARAAKEWQLGRLPVAYGLSIGEARSWGLYISSGRGTSSAGVEEPKQFAEPGIFLVKPDHTLYGCIVSSMPFARPHFADVLKGIEFIIENEYPARGEA